MDLGKLYQRTYLCLWLADSLFRGGKSAGSGFHGCAFGLSWERIRAFVGRNWAFVGSDLGLVVGREKGTRVFVEADSGFRGCGGEGLGFRGEGIGLSWGRVRAFVRFGLLWGFELSRGFGFSWGRGRFGLSWGRIRAFVGRGSGFRGEGFGLS